MKEKSKTTTTITTLHILGLVRKLNTLHARRSSDAHVLMTLISHRGITGKIHPSVSTLCDETKLSRSQVHRALKHWRDLGILTVPRKGYTGHSNEYSFNYDKAESMCHGCDVSAPSSMCHMEPNMSHGESSMCLLGWEHVSLMTHQELCKSFKEEEADASGKPVLVKRESLTVAPGEEQAPSVEGKPITQKGQKSHPVGNPTRTPPCAETVHNLNTEETCVTHDKPVNRAAEIRRAKESEATWEYELQKAQQKGTDQQLISTCTVMLIKARKGVETLLLDTETQPAA